MLQIQNLNLNLNKQNILTDINFEINDGEILSIIGPSGCGKSSILKSIVGIIKEHDGTILLNKIDITNWPINKRNITLAFQDFSLFPHMTLEKNMLIASNSKTDIDYILTELDIEYLKDKYPHQMSGGEQQRASVARAIIYKPQVLLLDEPFSNVDAITTKIIRKKITNIIKKFNITTIMVTHDLEDVFEMSDRCIVMKKAEIEQQGYLWELYNTPKNSYVAELFGEVLVVNDKKYRPENIKIYKKNTNNALQCMILNVKFNKNYNELTLLFEDKKVAVVYDYHRLNSSIGDYIYIEMGIPLNI